MRKLNAGGFAAGLLPFLGLLVPSFSPAGFAITPGSPPRCKLYLRPLISPLGPIRGLAHSILGQVSTTLIAAIEDGFEQSLESLPHRALILSTSGFSTGGPLDFKLDLCGHCLFKEDGGARRAIERLGHSLSIDTLPYRAMCEDIGAFGMQMPHKMIAFVGVGANTAAEFRMSVYLTPPSIHNLSI